MINKERKGLQERLIFNHTSLVRLDVNFLGCQGGFYRPNLTSPDLWRGRNKLERGTGSRGRFFISSIPPYRSGDVKFATLIETFLANNESDIVSIDS